MGNLARKLQQEKQRKVVETPKKVKVKSFGITPGEKILGIAFSAALCFGAVHIVSNQADIYELNKEIQETRVTIQEQQKINNDLGVQVGELSTYERIWSRAKELGLQFNENNVKVVQE